MFTTIIHPLRKALQLSCNEYCVMDSIYNLSNNSEFGGYCIASKQYLADELDIDKRSIINIINALELKELVERSDKINGAIRPTKFLRFIMQSKSDWQIAIKSNEFELMSVKLQDALDTQGVKKLHTTSENFSPASENISHNKEINNNTNKVISNPSKLGNEYSPEFEGIWKLYISNKVSYEGNKLIAYKKFSALLKAKEFRLMFEQSLLKQKIEAYLLDCHLSNRSNKHFSTYLNSKEWESTYLCESFKDVEIKKEQLAKLSLLFEENNLKYIWSFLSYLGASNLNDKFKGSVNTYLQKINDTQGFKMSFSRFAGTYVNGYKGEWLNY